MINNKQQTPCAVLVEWCLLLYQKETGFGLILWWTTTKGSESSRVESEVSGPIKKDTSIWKLTVSGESQSESEREFDRSTILQARLQGEERWTDLFFLVTTTTKRPVVLRALIFITHWLPACLPWCLNELNENHHPWWTGARTVTLWSQPTWTTQRTVK